MYVFNSLSGFAFSSVIMLLLLGVLKCAFKTSLSKPTYFFVGIVSMLTGGFLSIGLGAFLKIAYYLH